MTFVSYGVNGMSLMTFVAVPLLLIVSTGTCFKSVLLYGKFLFVVVVVARMKTCFCVHM